MPPENNNYPHTTSLTTIRNRALFEISHPKEEVRVNHFGNEIAFTQILLEHLLEDDIFFDIGACVGVITLFAAKIVKQVVAFEPDPFYFTRLVGNLELNQLSKVQALPWAIAAEEAMVKFYTSAQADDNSPSLIPRDYASSVDVRQRSVDEAITAGDLPIPTAIKIDIEGAEYAALCGMVDLLHAAHAPRILFIEIHPDFLPKFGASIKQVMDILDSAGYQISYRQQRSNQYHLIVEKNPPPAAKDLPTKVLFVPSNDTHATWMLPIAAAYPQANPGVSCLFMILPGVNERARETLDVHGLNYYTYGPGLLRTISPSTVILGNDWGASEQIVVGEARLLGIATVCIQEGPLLFDPLQNQLGHADYALLQGEVMKKYVANRHALVVGNPKYAQLSPLALPTSPRVMINCNFTYGVFEDWRDAWVSATVDACRQLDLDLFISQHPRDKGILDASYPVVRSNAALVPEQLQESTVLITRFSTLIYEALQMGRQVVYYDPMDEPYLLIKDNNNGAVFYARTETELRAALQAACSPPPDQPETVHAFLGAHCGQGDAVQNINHAIHEISQAEALSPAVSLEAYQNYCNLVAELEHQERLNLQLWTASEEVRQGNQWLETQRLAWENTAAARQETIGQYQHTITTYEQELSEWRYMGLNRFLGSYSRRKWNNLKSKIRKRT